MADRVVLGARGHDGQPLLEVPGGDLAQDRVGELGGAHADAQPYEVDGRADGGVRGHPRLQELVHADADGVEQRRVDLLRRPVAARGDDLVVGAEAAQGAVRQLGRQRGVPPGQTALAQQGGISRLA